MILRAPGLHLSLDPLIAEAKHRARRRRVVVALSVVLLAGGAASALALRSFGASDPNAVLGSMVAAARGQHSVHWSETRMEDILGEWRVTSDVTARSGIERLTIPGLALGTRPSTGEVDVRLLNGVAYVKGDRKGLQWFLVLTDVQAARYAGRWISIPRTDRLYAHVSDGLTLASVVSGATPDLGKGLKTTVTRGMSHATPVLVFREGDPRSIHLRLSARASNERLPITVFASTSPVSWFQGTFSKWNEPVRITAPAQAVAITTVLAR